MRGRISLDLWLIVRLWQCWGDSLWMKMIGTRKIQSYKHYGSLKMQLKCHALQSKVLETPWFPNHKHEVKKSFFFIFKSLLNLLQHCFCFMFWFFGPEACGILVPWPGIKHSLPALEGKVLTTGPPGKSLVKKS